MTELAIRDALAASLIGGRLDVYFFGSSSALDNHQRQQNLQKFQNLFALLLLLFG